MGESKLKLNDVYGSAKEQNKRQLCRFMQDMRRAGYKQQVFSDKAKWSGPAVVCRSEEDVETVLAETKVPCFSVQKGTRFVVYPKQGL